MAAAQAISSTLAAAVRPLARPAFTTATNRLLAVRTSPLTAAAATRSKLRTFASASSASPSVAAATKPSLAVGEKLPEATLSYFDDSGAIQSIKVSDLTSNKRVVIFAVPGAFTPTCSSKHVPGFVEKADELVAKGVDTIACVSVNDAFVMKSWGEGLGAKGKILMLADGNGKFTRELGVTLDLSDKAEGLGVRSRRYSLFADDGVVKVLNLEEGGAFTSSGADEMLKALDDLYKA